MNDSEGLLDLLGANTVAFRAESISVTWAASEEERAVDERLQISLRVTTEPRDDELKPFTDRFGEGWVTLIALKGEYQHNDDGQPVIGILGRRNDEIIVRVLVSPTYLVGLSATATRFAGAPIRISVWPYKKLSEWNGEDWLHVRHCEVTVGSINLSKMN